MDDFSKLDFEELVRYRELQRKMRVATGSIEGYEALKVEELKQLERFTYKMMGKPYPWDHTLVHVAVVPDRAGSGVTAASNPPAVSPAPTSEYNGDIGTSHTSTARKAEDPVR